MSDISENEFSEDTEMQSEEESFLSSAISALDGKETVEEAKEEVKEPEVEIKQPKKDTLSEVYSRSLELESQVRDLKRQLASTPKAKDLKALAAENPLSVLEEAGLSVEDIIQYWASQGIENKETTNIDELDNKVKKDPEIDELKSQLAQLQEHLQQKQVSEAKSQTFNEIDSVIAKNDEERWEYVNGLKSEGSYELVIEVATELFKSTNEVPTYEEVLDAVENHLAETLENQSQKLARFKKIQKKLAIENLGSKVKSQVKQTEEELPPLTSLFNQGASASIPTDDSDEQARWHKALKALESK